MENELKYPPLIDLEQINPEIFDDYSDIDSLIRITTPFFRQQIKCEPQICSSYEQNLNHLIVLPIIDSDHGQNSDNSSDLFAENETNNNRNNIELIAQNRRDDPFSGELTVNGSCRRKSSKRLNKLERNSKDKDFELKLSKKISDIKYRSKMREQYDKLSFVIIGKDIKWRKKELLDLAVKYIVQLKHSNKELVIENIKLKNQIESVHSFNSN